MTEAVSQATRWKRLILAGCVLYGGMGVVALMPKSTVVPQYPSGIASLSPYTFLGKFFHGSPATLSIAFIVMTAGAFFVGFRAWRLAHLGEAARLAFIGGVLFSGLLILTPPIISQDVYSYSAYGRMFALHDANPYVEGPVAIADDPSANYVGRMWWEMPSVYGPVIQLGTSGLAWLIRDYAAYVIALKFLATIFLWLGMWFLVDLARRFGRSPTIALVVVGWNPLVVVHIAGGGHNDIFMAVALLAALSLHLRGRENLAIVVLGLGSMVKFLAGVPLLLYLILIWRSTPKGRRAVRAFESLGILAVMAIAGYLPFWHGPETFGALLRVSGLGSHIALPTVVGKASAFLIRTVGFRAVTDGQMTFVARLGGGVFFFWYFIRLARNLKTDEQLPEVWGKILLVYCLTTGYLQPWYLVWAILPLALVPESKALKLAVIAGFVYSFTQLPGGYVLLGNETRRAGPWIALAIAPIVIAVAVALYVKHRRSLQVGVCDPKSTTAA